MSGIITASVNISSRCINLIPQKVVHKRRFTADTYRLFLGLPNTPDWSHWYEKSAGWIPRKEISIYFVHTGYVLSAPLVSNADFKACYKGCDRIEENLRRTWNSREPTQWQRQGILWDSENILQEEKGKNDQKLSLPPAISRAKSKDPTEH